MIAANRRGLQCLTMILASVSAAADPPPTSQPAPPDPATRPMPDESRETRGAGILAGPPVEGDALGDRPDRARGDEGRARDAIPPRRWFALLREVELTPGQEDEVGRITRELHRARRTFERDHGAELRRLREAMREARSTGAAVSDEVRTRFQALRAKHPDVFARQEAIWALLTPPQQERMLTEIARVREEIAKRREQRGGGEPDERTRRRLEFLRSRIVE